MTKNDIEALAADPMVCPVLFGRNDPFWEPGMTFAGEWRKLIEATVADEAVATDPTIIVIY